MLDRLARKKRRLTLGADKGYDTRDFVAELRQRKVTPHVSQNQSGRRSAIDGRTTSHGGYKVSQKIRKRVEEIFGWVKTVGGGRKLRYIGLEANQLLGGIYGNGLQPRADGANRASAGRTGGLGRRLGSGNAAKGHQRSAS